ncbi:hypothetical protein JOM56_011064 [Amanita muscaria]
MCDHPGPGPGLDQDHWFSSSVLGPDHGTEPNFGIPTTGASPKLAVLNADGKVWTMVASGGHSGEGQTYKYANTMPATFKVIIRALKEYKSPLIAHSVKFKTFRRVTRVSRQCDFSKKVVRILVWSIELGAGFEECSTPITPVTAMTCPFGGHHIQKLCWGAKETLLPSYTSPKEAVVKHPNVDIVVNFASSESVYSSTLESLTYPQRKVLYCRGIGDSGGMMDNIISPKLQDAGPSQQSRCSRANSDAELANAENRAMRGTELIIPDTFEELSRMLKEACERLELDLIPKPAGFISTISDEHDVFKEDIGIGSVVALLWCKRRLPPWTTKFIEMVLILTAEHRPAVFGAMNTIVVTRASKDFLLSVSWLLLQANKLVSGIKHKIKGGNNSGLHVELIKEYVRKPSQTTPSRLRMSASKHCKQDTISINSSSKLTAVTPSASSTCSATAVVSRRLMIDDKTSSKSIQVHMLPSRGTIVEQLPENGNAGTIRLDGEYILQCQPAPYSASVWWWRIRNEEKLNKVSLHTLQHLSPFNNAARFNLPDQVYISR